MTEIDDFKAKTMYRVLDGTLTLSAARTEIAKHEKEVTD